MNGGRKTALAAQAPRYSGLPSGLSDGRSLALVLLVYATAHAALRLSFSGNFTTDDAQAVLYLSSLSLVYSIYQPPLYEWLLWGFQAVFGVSMAATLALKFALLGATAYFLYQSALLVGGNRAVAAITVLCWSLFYQVGWNLLEGSTHTSMVLFSTSLTILALLKIILDGRALSYGLLGVAVAAGMLSKFSYPVFLLAVILTVVLTKDARTRLKLPHFALALAAGLALSAPYYLAILSQEGAALALNDKMNRDADASLFGLLIGPQKVLIGSLLFSLAFLPVFLAFFGRDLPYARLFKGRSPGVREGAPLDGALFCLRLVFVSLALVAAGAFVFGIDNIKERHLHPYFLALPIALLAMVPAGASTLRKFGHLRRVILIVALGIFAVRFVTLAFPGEAVCGRCREMVPYAGLAEVLKAYPEAGLIIAEDPYIAANLKRLMPRSTVINPLIHSERRSGWPGERNTFSGVSGCLLISGAESTFNQDGKDVVTIAWRGMGGTVLDRTSRWSVAVINGADGGKSCIAKTKPEK